MNPHRPLPVLLVSALVGLTGCSTVATTPTVALPTSVPVPPRALVIDTDMAIDDWMAILYLLQRPEVRIRAITITGAGEAHCAPGIHSALGLVALSGKDPIPMACGRETPLQGHHAFPASWRASVDSLLGLTLPEGPTTASTLTAVELLTSIIRASPGKVTLLTLGPLTNIAEALHNDPSLVDHIEQIYLMGGAVTVPGNVGTAGVGIANPKAEWNIYVDPAAANRVLHSGASITLVPLDATHHVPLTAQFYERLKRYHPSPVATFVFKVLTQLQAFIGSGRFFLWDPLAAAILTDESLATFQTKTLCVVETEGPDSGWTKVATGCPAIRVAVSADRGRFEPLFLDTLNTASP